MKRTRDSRDRRPGTRSAPGPLVAAVLLLTAASPALATGTVEMPATKTVTDALGRTVEVPVAPQRIVTAGRAVLMIADALYLFPGVSERIVGIGRIDQGKGNFLAAIDPDYHEKTVLERNVGPGQVVALAPDLVILKSFMRERLGEGVERLGIPVVYVDLETPEQYQRDLRLLGEVLGRPARGRELAGYYERTSASIERAVRDTIDAGASRPRTLFLYADLAGGETVFNVPPRGWIQTTLVELAGGEPVWIDAISGGGWNRVGLEQIAAWNPEVVALVAYRQDATGVREALRANRAASRLDAVANDALHLVPLDFYSWDQPDARWILGLAWLADTLHPGVLGEELGETFYGFFEFAYRMNREEVDEIVVPRLEGFTP